MLSVSLVFTVTPLAVSFDPALFLLLTKIKELRHLVETRTFSTVRL